MPYGNFARVQATYDAMEPPDDREAWDQWCEEHDVVGNLKRLAREMALSAADCGSLPTRHVDSLTDHIETWLRSHLRSDERVEMMAATRPLGSEAPIAPSFDSWRDSGDPNEGDPPEPEDGP